jgi:hypothetical protein
MKEQKEHKEKVTFKDIFSGDYTEDDTFLDRLLVWLGFEDRIWDTDYFYYFWRKQSVIPLIILAILAIVAIVALVFTILSYLFAYLGA